MPADYRTYRDKAGGKAIVSLVVDSTDANKTRSVTAKIEKVLRPLAGKHVEGDVVAITEDTTAATNSKQWSVTTSQVPNFVSTAAIKGG
jgi:hypothetical protein